MASSDPQSLTGWVQAIAREIQDLLEQHDRWIGNFSDYSHYQG